MITTVKCHSADLISCTALLDIEELSTNRLTIMTLPCVYIERQKEREALLFTSKMYDLIALHHSTTIYQNSSKR